MTAAIPASELLPLPPSGRRFTIERTVRLSDVDAGGSLRFDAISRYLQDVASDDAIDAGLPNAMGWVVRRTMIRIDQTCALGERLSATTFCTGVGRSWAERRSSLVGSDGGAVEAVSLWIQVDVDTGRPTRLGDEFFGTYGEAAGGRTVSSRLSLDPPADSGVRSRWRFRPIRCWSVKRCSARR